MEDRSHRSQLLGGGRRDESIESGVDYDSLFGQTARDAHLNDVQRLSSGTNASPSTSESSSSMDTPPDDQNLDVTSNPSSFASTTRVSSSARSLKLLMDSRVADSEDQGSQWEWLLGFGSNVRTGGLTDNIADDRVENRIKNASHTEIEGLKAELYAMARQADISELELQTLRKQIVKERKRSRNSSGQVDRLKTERDVLEKEVESLKEMRNPLEQGRNLEHVLQELRQELNHEREINSNLRLQLSKTQESNAELVLAVKDLDEMLKQKNNEIPDKFGMHRGENEDLCSQIERYKRNKDDLEMQLEQLTLDYEILRQENHEISHKLEQSRLQEQLKIQYDCFSCFPAVDELENQIEMLEKELDKKSEEMEKQSRVFEADLDGMRYAKIKQEERAIRAENELQKMRLKHADIAGKLQVEFRALSEQMVSTFEANEITATKAVMEASKLRLEKSQMEEMLGKANEEILTIKDDCETKVRETADRIEEMMLETGEKTARLECQHQEIMLMRSEITRLTMENEHLSNKLLSLELDLKNHETAVMETDIVTENRNAKGNERVDAIEVLKKEIKCSEEKLSSLRSMTEEKDLTIDTLKSQLSNLKRQADETIISAREHEPDKQKSRNQAAKPKKEINSITRTAGKKRSNLTAASDKKKGIHIYANIKPDVVPHCNKTGYSEQDNAVANKENANATSSVGDAIESEAAISISDATESKLDALIAESEMLKEKNRSMEVELKELQERYSEISLKFAEVEGERQQLVMTVRNLVHTKNN